MPAAVRRATLALTVCLLLAPAVAHASWQGVVQDCRDGRIDSHHSLGDYTQALAHLPSDVIEYTDCQSLIRRAQLGVAAGSGKHRGGGGGSGTTGKGGSTSPSASGTTGGSGPSANSAPAPSGNPLATATPVQRAAVTHAIQSGGQPVRVGQRVLRPGALGAGSSGSPTSLPGALVVLLVALGIGGLGVGAASLGPRVRARRAR